MIVNVFLLKVSCPTDCRLWQQIMYFHFEENWVKLHHGPMWCTSSSTQDLDCDAIHTTQQHESENHRGISNECLFYATLVVFIRL